MRKSADRIYTGGDIVTMDPGLPSAEAIATCDGQILKVGSRDEVAAVADSRTEIIDLKGRTVLPGFIDAHSHFIRAGLYDRFLVDLRSPPIGRVRTMHDLISAMRQAAHAVPRGTWVMGYGYDDTLLAEKRHPAAADLDRASTDHLMHIKHVSGHLAVLNTPALQKAGINRETVDPTGGRVRRGDAGEPNGILDGEPAMELARHALPAWGSEQWREAAMNASRMYAARGVTSAQEGDAQPEDYQALRDAHSEGLLRVRIQVYPNWRIIDRIDGFPGPCCGSPITPERMLVVGGVKMYQDGSIQGYSGYLSRPYHRLLYPQPEGSGYRGRPRNSLPDLAAAITAAHRAGWQIAVHANGDQAIEDVIDALEEADRTHPRKDARHIIIHCQTVREDQLDRMLSLSVLPSFFTTHTYFWGDRHRDIFLGPERAARLDPCGSAMTRGMSFTCHNDTYVTPIDPLTSVWSAVNRITAGGAVLGPEFRVPVMEALRSVTSYAAFQGHEENIKGTLSAGKVADMVVLDRNPLRIDPMSIRDVEVVATIVSDRLVHGELQGGVAP